MGAFGRYEILDKLGEGAMGVVYRARDRNLGRTVALKMLSEEFSEEEELQQRFEREAVAIGRLSHRNIVAVYDMGKVDERLFLAMELLEGDDLRSLVDRQVAVSMADRVRIALQICEGLGYAHSRGVVHRDVKPANILVTTSGEVKLLDFGLARVAASEAITRRGVILGTPDYMAPEQASGRSTDERTDLFSAGAVFYEFLTWQKPFRGKTLHAVLYQIVSGRPDPMLTLNPEVPARVAEIVTRMLEREIERRQPSMEAVAEALRPVHAALRRSRSYSAFYGSAPLDEGKSAFRGHVTCAREHLEAGRCHEAVGELDAALAIDPSSDEAAELLWQAKRRLHAAAEPPTVDPARSARIDELLAAANAAQGEDKGDVRGILAELALVAPDDPRVVALLREAALPQKTRPAKPSQAGHS